MIPGATPDMVASQTRLRTRARRALVRPSPSTLDGLLWRRPDLADMGLPAVFRRELARWSA